MMPAEHSDILFEARFAEKYLHTFHGSKDDTMELNINFKTLLMGHFRELAYLKELTAE